MNFSFFFLTIFYNLSIASISFLQSKLFEEGCLNYSYGNTPSLIHQCWMLFSKNGFLASWNDSDFWTKWALECENFLYRYNLPGVLTLNWFFIFFFVGTLFLLSPFCRNFESLNSLVFPQINFTWWHFELLLKIFSTNFLLSR